MLSGLGGVFVYSTVTKNQNTQSISTVDDFHCFVYLFYFNWTWERMLTTVGVHFGFTYAK